MLLLERFQSHLHVILMRFDAINRLKHVSLVTIPFNTFKYNILHSLYLSNLAREGNPP